MSGTFLKVICRFPSEGRVYNRMLNFTYLHTFEDPCIKAIGLKIGIISSCGVQCLRLERMSMTNVRTLLAILLCKLSTRQKKAESHS